MTMVRIATVFFAAVLAAGALVPGSAPQAGTGERVDEGAYDLRVRGLRAAVVSFRGVEDAGSYAVAARIESSGLVGLVRNIRYDGNARGRHDGNGGFETLRYVEESDTGRRESLSEMVYENGVPRVVRREPPRERDRYADPAEQGGTIDPLTAMYSLFRDVEADQACRGDLDLFDGQRRAQIALSRGARDGDTLRCDGEFRRIEGYSEREIEEGTRFPFQLTYEARPDGRMRLEHVRMQTEYGPATMTRR